MDVAGGVGLHVGQGGREREGMCLERVHKLAKGDVFWRTVSGNRSGSLISAWEREDGIGVEIWTSLGLGPTLGFGPVKKIVGLNFHAMPACVS